MVATMAFDFIHVKVVVSTKLSNLLICLQGNPGKTNPRISVHEVGSSSSSPDLNLPLQTSGSSADFLLNQIPSLGVIDSSPKICDVGCWYHKTTLLQNVPSYIWDLRSAQI